MALYCIRSRFSNGLVDGGQVFFKLFAWVAFDSSFDGF